LPLAKLKYNTQRAYGASNIQLTLINEIMVSERDSGDMGKEERKELVLQFLGEHPLALRPIDVFRNLRLHRQITFSSDSVERYLDEFVDEGLVTRVNPHALEDAKIEEAGTGDRAYYIITDKGRNEIQNSDTPN
jgi:DNA-binding PadR family transcriptional regulator